MIFSFEFKIRQYEKLEIKELSPFVQQRSVVMTRFIFFQKSDSILYQDHIKIASSFIFIQFQLFFHYSTDFLF